MSRLKLAKRRVRSQPREIGKHRDPKASCFPPAVMKALQGISWRENKSISWIIATMVYDYFGLDESGYHAKEELSSKAKQQERKRA